MSATARVLEFREPFDLDGLVRDRLAETDIADPHELAKLIADELPEHEMRGIVRRLLGDRVRILSNGVRNSGHVSRARSAKWTAVSESADDIGVFRLRVCAAGVWKFLGECTREDVETLAAEHRGLAEANARRAAAYDALRQLMTRKRVSAVADLPAASVAEALS